MDGPNLDTDVVSRAIAIPQGRLTALPLDDLEREIVYGNLLWRHRQAAGVLGRRMAVVGAPEKPPKAAAPD
jgi:hypothetical protein